MCKAYKPDILVLDMGDKFARTGGFSRPDEALKANAIHARQIAKTYECAVFYMSQLSAEAEGKIVLNQAMMEGSRTGKAAEADLMVLIAKNPQVEGQEEEDVQRHLNIVKNKLSDYGDGGYITFTDSGVTDIRLISDGSDDVLAYDSSGASISYTSVGATAEIKGTIIYSTV